MSGKKLLAIFISTVLMLSMLAGCGDATGGSGDSDDSGKLTRSVTKQSFCAVDVQQVLVKTIFGNILGLCSAVEQTLAVLEKCVEESSYNTVTMPVLGPVFMAQMKNIAVHTDYVVIFFQIL